MDDRENHYPVQRHVPVTVNMEVSSPGGLHKEYALNISYIHCFITYIIIVKDKKGGWTKKENRVTDKKRVCTTLFTYMYVQSTASGKVFIITAWTILSKASRLYQFQFISIQFQFIQTNHSLIQ